MTNKDNGGPAFPVPETKIDDHCLAACYQGMTLRDWFAGQALAAAMKEYGVNPVTPADYTRSDYTVAHQYSEWAYIYADAMLRQRGK